MAIPAGSMAGNGPEGRVVDWKGVWWTGRASRGQEMNRRGIIGPESVAVVNVRLRHSWSVKSAKRGLSACSVEGPLTTCMHMPRYIVLCILFIGVVYVLNNTYMCETNI